MNPSSLQHPRKVPFADLRSVHADSVLPHVDQCSDPGSNHRFDDLGKRPTGIPDCEEVSAGGRPCLIPRSLVCGLLFCRRAWEDQAILLRHLSLVTSE